MAGFAPLLNGAGYVASKHALEGFMATLRAEEAVRGVSVLIVRPGFIDTPLVHKAMGGDGGRSEIPQRPVGGRMSPLEAAEAIVEAAACRRRDLILTPIAKVSWWITRLAPRLYDALMSATRRRAIAASDRAAASPVPRRPQEMTPGFRRSIVVPGKAGRRDSVAGYVPEAERS